MLPPSLLFFWAPKSLQMVTAAMKLRHLLLGRKVMTNLDSIFKSRDEMGCGAWRPDRNRPGWRSLAIHLLPISDL